MTNGFSPTQQAIMNVLADGKIHSRNEVMECLDDPEPTYNQLNQALFRLRKKLEPRGKYIDCVIQGTRRYYRFATFVETHEQ